MTIIDTLDARVESLTTEWRTLLDVATAEKRALTDDEQARKAAIKAELADIDERKADEIALESRVAAKVAKTVEAGIVPTVKVRSEERTYSRGGQHSFFQDIYNARENGNQVAQERLQRNVIEAIRDGFLEERATTTGSFAGLVVPQYLVDAAALVLRNGRPIANVIKKLPLPDQGTSFLIPRGTTGASEAIQATENTSASSTDEVWANVTVQVVTISGQQDVSRQSLERGTPGLDEIIWTDLANAYFAAQGVQIINGSGSSGQMLGILNTASINAATAFGAPPTAANFTSKVAGQVAAIAGSGTAIQPRVVVMNPRRWGWLQSLADTTGRPLAVATPVMNYNAAGIVTQPGGYSGDGADQGSNFQFVGMLANGLPVVTDANIPINVGTNVEDVVLVLDTQQMFLWEDGDGMPKMLRFEQTLGNQLTVKLVAYNYSAFTAGRYPQAVGKIGGLDTVATQGLVAPTF